MGNGLLGRDTGDQGGWHTFTVDARLVVEVPSPGASVLTADLATVIGAAGAFGSTVIIEANPDCDAPRVREETPTFLGTVCPDCLTEKDWNEAQWMLYLAPDEDDA